VQLGEGGIQRRPVEVAVDPMHEAEVVGTRAGVELLE
jgi:hypothetical protein